MCAWPPVESGWEAGSQRRKAGRVAVSVAVAVADAVAVGGFVKSRKAELLDAVAAPEDIISESEQFVPISGVALPGSRQ
jgi:hypothetical protein